MHSTLTTLDVPSQARKLLANGTWQILDGTALNAVRGTAKQEVTSV